jgi:hypothetical protein
LSVIFFALRSIASPQQPTRRSFAVVTLAVSLAMLTLTGCGPKRLRSDFTSFEKAFATTSNREVLLNLVRLQEHDPTYFFKLGQITSSYRMQGTLTGSGNYTIPTANIGGNATGGGTPGLLYESDPSFTFIPVNDETNAKFLLQPIAPETFQILFEQGWRVDQLFRLMVDRIEYSEQTHYGCEVQVVRNAPPLMHGGDTTYSHDQAELRGYRTFLRVSALMYALQRRGHLLLQGKYVFIPFDERSFVKDDSDAPAQKDPDARAKPEPGTDSAARAPKGHPELRDILDASSKNGTWELQDGKWMLGSRVFQSTFYLNPLLPPSTDANSDQKPYTAIQKDILSTNEYNELNDGVALENTLSILSAGFTIEGAVEPAKGPDKRCNPAPHIVLRSLLGVMASAAQEEAPFEALLQHDPVVTRTERDKQESRETRFLEGIPAIERLPTIRLSAVKDKKENAPTVELNYRGKGYLIADLTDPALPENDYWNRDIFRLINQLASQVTVDISKFPLPNILQLHQ